ncbi:MAG: hypothetical protein ACOVNQ_07575, partial [Pirellula sp.]
MPGTSDGDCEFAFARCLALENPLARCLAPENPLLYPEEQSRVLELLVETVTVSKASVDIHFRAN